ncbi:TspO/MBR family protein [Paraburkholderia sp. Cy-641]|uniref:TspO/MBR family protein n=1 Tax=Paraburkholderia sp. Cy-641 TaxID=2608337 RepID=UPI001F039FF6|nr:TspO/MBR family protein [Paraburkholderia sp. Cy-641]
MKKNAWRDEDAPSAVAARVSDSDACGRLGREPVLAGGLVRGTAKPAFNPPNWVFPPVWSVLYVLMAFSAWRVWKRDGLSAAIVLWVVQLVFNAAWMWLFFGLHRPEMALTDIVILLVLIVMLTGVFWRRDRLAGVMLMPYVIWVAYAALLNYALWQLNPAA